MRRHDIRARVLLCRPYTTGGPDCVLPDDDDKNSVRVRRDGGDVVAYDFQRIRRRRQVDNGRDDGNNYQRSSSLYGRAETPTTMPDDKTRKLMRLRRNAFQRNLNN